MRAVSLHHDVIVATSRLLQTNCTIVRGGREVFVIDSPILPDELDVLPSLLEQAGFGTATGLLATHADWDHLLGPLAFPQAPLGCAESSAARLAAEPGAAQRELRSFDEGLYLRRPRPLSLAAVQALPVPGRCEVGEHELELHQAAGHTADGMAIHVPWARALIAGDYLSAVEIPTIAPGGIGDYEATLARLQPLVSVCDHVVPGHGPVLERASAQRVLEEDVTYLGGLRDRGAATPLPAGRRSREQRRLHAENVRRL